MDIERLLIARYGQNERELAIYRKNALFAGRDAGAENRATIASPTEISRLNTVDPLVRLTVTLRTMASGHKQSQIKNLLPWHHAAQA